MIKTEGKGSFFVRVIGCDCRCCSAGAPICASYSQSGV